MSNHLHLLLAVDDEVAEQKKPSMTEAEILKRCRAIYSKEAMIEIEWEFKNRAKMAGEKAFQQYRQSFLNRMWNLSAFVREIKQRFSQWYNKRNDRKGPLWEDRFKSVLLEGKDGDDLVWIVGAYIDLNSVRAGIVEDPADYRYSGYGAAVGGDKLARKRIKEMLGMSGQRWAQVAKLYRMVLMERGVEGLDD